MNQKEKADKVKKTKEEEMKKEFIRQLEEDDKKRKVREEKEKWAESDDDEVYDGEGKQVKSKVRAPKYDIIYSYPVDLGVKPTSSVINLKLGLLEQ